MMAKLIPVFLLATMIAAGCTDDNKENSQSNVTTIVQTAQGIGLDSTLQLCDSVFVATYPGTACCVSGTKVAKPGDTVSYHYQINYPDPEYHWEVREGDINIISGQDTQTVVVQFGPDFKGGVIGSVGSGIKEGTRLSCSDRCIIRTP
jgi:hypothetical protein